MYEYWLDSNICCISLSILHQHHILLHPRNLNLQEPFKSSHISPPSLIRNSHHFPSLPFPLPIVLPQQSPNYQVH